MKRSRIKPVSAKRRAGSAARKAAVEAAFERDGYRCIPADRGAPGQCFGKLTPHRLFKGSAGGGYTVDNVMAACAFHNDWIEDEPIKAQALGLVHDAQGETR